MKVCLEGKAVVPGGVVQGKKSPLHLGLAGRLKEARKEARIRSTNLALAAGLARSTVSNIERGDVPRIHMVERLAALLRVSACWLAYGYEGRVPWREKTPRTEPRPEGPELIGSSAAAEDRPPYGFGPLPAVLSSAGVGVRLRQARLAAGLTIKGLGRESQTSDTTVRKAEEGQTVPTVATIEALAKALRASPCWLAFGVGEGPEGA